MSKPVITPSEAKSFTMEPEGGSDQFKAEIRDVNTPLGLELLGAMHVTVEPGKRAFPFHNHLGNDEMFIILEGEGTYRFGEEEIKVKAGDVCGAPRGGPDTAHQLINTGFSKLVYIGISTQRDPDIVEYPDSGKFAALGIYPGKTFFDAHMKHIGKPENAVGYWDGEDT